jgi:hypothetical protein
MGRPKLYPHDRMFWDSVRATLDSVHSTGHTWTTIAEVLGVGKQTLTGFRKGRVPALEAEALLKLCLNWKVPLTFRDQMIQCGVGGSQPDAADGLQLRMEFDDSFELEVGSTPRAILTRKPPDRVSYVGIRIERLSKKSG